MENYSFRRARTGCKAAARRAGSTRAEGQLYYFFLKPGKTAGAAPAATDAPPEESTPIEDAASAAVG